MKGAHISYLYSMKEFFLLCMVLVFILACKEEQALMPKPRMYPRIEFPEKVYKEFVNTDCDFSFQIPAYSQIEKETKFFEEEPLHPCWFDINIPQLNGKIHCSYFPINSKKEFEGLVEDAYEFISKHNQKANYRDEVVIQKPNNVSGLIFEMSGDVATPVQFFLTDSTSHYLRGSVYFYSQVDPDSMAVVYDFVKEDVAKLIETFEWND